MTDHAEYAAGARLRKTLEQDVMPAVGKLLGATVDGHPIPACEHMNDSTRRYLDHRSGMIFCDHCAAVRLAEVGMPPCQVCGMNDADSGATLVGWAVGVTLGAPVLVETGGEVIAWLGSLATLPIASECPAHDGFLDSEITILWNPGQPAAA